MKRNQLEEFGITDKDTIDKIMNINGGEVEAEKAKYAAFETENGDLKTQLEASSQTIASLEAKANVPDEVKAELESYKTKVSELEGQIKDRDYTGAIKSYLNGYKFTSKLAEDAVLAQLKAKELKLEDGKPIGADDIMAKIKSENPGAFEVEGKPAPSAVDTPGHDNGQGQHMSYTREQIEHMSTADINANWADIQASLANIK